jgi:hypothetical protein
MLAHVQLACNLWYHGSMIDFPITQLLDESICLIWLERHLHPDGFVCPHCGSSNRRLFREQRHFLAYRCRECDGYYTLLTGTVFEKTRHTGAAAAWHCQGRIDCALGARTRNVPAASADPPPTAAD